MVIGIKNTVLVPKNMVLEELKNNFDSHKMYVILLVVHPQLKL